MKVTSVQIRKIEKEDSRLRGFANVILDDQLVIHDIKIVEGKQRFFVAMPNRKLSEGNYVDIVHPISNELRNTIEQEIIKMYEIEGD